jgi:hypothetical protein
MVLVLHAFLYLFISVSRMPYIISNVAVLPHAGISSL